MTCSTNAAWHSSGNWPAISRTSTSDKPATCLHTAFRLSSAAAAETAMMNSKEGTKEGKVQQRSCDLYTTEINTRDHFFTSVIASGTAWVTVASCREITNTEHLPW